MKTVAPYNALPGMYQYAIDHENFRYEPGEQAAAFEALTQYHAKMLQVNPLAVRARYYNSYPDFYPPTLLEAEQSIRWFRSDLNAYRYVREGCISVRDYSEDISNIEPFHTLRDCELLGVVEYLPNDRRLRMFRRNLVRRAWWLCHRPEPDYVDGISWPPLPDEAGGTAVAVERGGAFPEIRKSSIVGYSERELSPALIEQATGHRDEFLRVHREKAAREVILIAQRAEKLERERIERENAIEANRKYLEAQRNPYRAK